MVESRTADWKVAGSIPAPASTFSITLFTARRAKNYIGMGEGKGSDQNGREVSVRAGTSKAGVQSLQMHREKGGYL